MSAIAVVLRALAGARARHDFTLTSPAGTAIRWQGEGWTCSQASALFGRGKDMTTLTFTHVPVAQQNSGWMYRMSLNLRTRTVLYSLLARNGMASSVPILCDGLWLTGCAHAADLTPGTTTRQVAVLPIPLSTAPPVAFWVPTGWGGIGPGDSEIGFHYRLSLPVPPSTSEMIQTPAIATLYVSLRDAHDGKNDYTLGPTTLQVCWVKDGIVVERQTLQIQEALGVLIYVNAHGIPTDISGFALQEGKDLDIRLDELRKALHEALQELLSDVQRIKLKVGVNPVWIYLMGAALLSPAILSGGGGIFFGLLSGGGMRWLGHKQQRSLGQLNDQILVELRKFAESVRKAQ